MPEETTNTTPETPASDTPQGQVPAAESGAEAKTFSEDYVKALRDENAKWRKQVRDFEGRLTDFEKAEAARKEATLKEQQKFEELAAQYARERDELKVRLEQQALDLLRTRIATEYALPPALAVRLVGKSEDELRADAEALKGLIPAPTPAAPAAASAQAPAARPQTTTTPIPTGTTGETDAQRRARLFGTPIS
jgi:hypothetical protein